MRRVFVTGAGGFIGHHVARHFATLGEKVFALYRGPTPPALATIPNITAISGDLRDPSCFPVNYDVLVHAAAVIPARVTTENELATVNAAATEALFAHAKDAGASRIVFCSSMSVYGKITVPVVTMDTPAQDPDEYGRSKQAGERALRQLIAVTPTIAGLSLRLPGVIGPGSHHNFLSDVGTKIFAGAAVKARNSSSLFNNVVYVDDLTRFISQWTNADVGCYRAATIAAHSPLTISTILAELCRAAGRPFDISFNDSANGSFIIDLRAAEDLGFQPASTLDSIRAFAADLAARSGTC